MRRIAIEVALFGCFLALTVWPHSRLKSLERSKPEDGAQLEEVLYLPDGEALELMSFGYRNVLADVLWFNTINYFGKHYHTDQDYRWLAHMCDLVVRLDPEAFHVYEFGSTMLGWEMNQPRKAIALLDRGIEAFPDSWRLYYLRGFTYMFFLKDPERAQADFITASKKPGAHYITARLAAKGLATQDDPETAIAFLNDMLETTEDPSARRALEHRLDEAVYERDMRFLERAVSIFRERHGRLPKEIGELASGGIVTRLPRDPFGGRYYIDESSGEPRSTSGRKRLRIYGNAIKEATGQ